MRQNRQPRPPMDLPALSARLRKGFRRLTGPRQAILEVLRRETHPLTHKEIYLALPKGDCDLATVYRSLRLLTEMGMVKRFDFGDGLARHELISDGDDGHHHHLICTRCAGIVEVEECDVSAFEARVAARNGFRDVTHKLEFFGICPACL